MCAYSNCIKEKGCSNYYVYIFQEIFKLLVSLLHDMRLDMLCEYTHSTGFWFLTGTSPSIT